MGAKYVQNIYYIAVFDSRNYAVQLYQHLKRMRYKQFQLVSTPCVLNAGCSYSIRFDELEDYHILSREAEKLKKDIISIYEAKRVDRNRVLKQLDLN
ncbi:DUF3343 domain-containing protein [Natronincola ferrireducens]|uniref:Putative Se/S carrier protein-like domain-containing protein n=1 Tax=Natronincola ferrireducens TaxID=393762 RepID=A0A1G9CT52_9FIRM|nr:DUF3343 domain-containing protein [Natronincola ferrireducens]SDK54799.1 Protein of unknown function [Natronincola ferrireducens]